ncbi:MAG: methyltransferase domain-containing protein [Alphaproteobacteria bacterium]|nr:methyltransferase domain-containing protein [Alphaproteobacteria bacterium]
MSQSPTVFNRRAVRRTRDRAARSLGGHDFLLAEAAERLLDHLDDVKRGFPVALDLGCRTGTLAALRGNRGGIGALVQCDLSEKMARAAQGHLTLAADEEALPFAPASFDLVLSSLALHWVNDLPGALAQIRRVLKPDGLFLASLFGGETLKELRQALAEAELQTAGGASPRVSPFAELRDLGGLLQRAGFALPVADADTIIVSYDEPMKLLADLRGMGETNAHALRRAAFSRRELFPAMAETYRRLFADETGRVPATFQIVTLTAWAPHASQPQPLKPGSAQTSLAKALSSKKLDDYE